VSGGDLRKNRNYLERRLETKCERLEENKVIFNKVKEDCSEVVMSRPSFVGKGAGGWGAKLPKGIFERKSKNAHAWTATEPRQAVPRVKVGQRESQNAR